MTDDPLVRAFEAQGAVCAAFGSAFYAALCPLIASDLGACIRAPFAPWQGASFEDLMGAAVTLRLLGAIHDLALSGDDPAVTGAFPPTGDAAAAWEAAKAAIERDPARFAVFMAHEPQTNEVRRSACLLPGFLAVAAETRLPLACLELGASAGLNQLWRRYRYDYGAAGAWGDPAAPLALAAEWTGAPPALDTRLQVASTSACDRKPVDLADPAQRRRLKAYLWPDQTERIERFDAAVEMALAAGVGVEAADAVDWTLARAAPRPGVATVVYHSIFWQYLAPHTQATLTEAVEHHGAAATRDAPLAWLRMEPAPGQVMPIELRLTLWPGGEERRLATVQAHGAWVTWGG
ncbi:MAG TPA: DUF2332 family protein [Caulobacteraceae bacterium]|jgi:hypothetical protein